MRIAGVVFMSALPARRGILLSPLRADETLARFKKSQQYAVNQPGWAKYGKRITAWPAFELRRGRDPAEAADALQALLADGYEALIAAIYLDGGIEQARAFVTREFSALVAEAREGSLSAEDYKSALQEYLQSRDEPLPEYRLAAAVGPDHRKQFQVELLRRGEVMAQAIGPTKKEAEQEAARLTLERLKQRAD